VTCPEGEKFYGDETYTDQDPEFRISEIIREKTINRMQQELPHAIYIEISDMEMHAENLWVRGFICVERESQKGIVIGKGGRVIKQIRLESETELAKLFPYKVKLDLRVRVHPKWRRCDNLLKKLIK
jgi:GTPase